MAVPADNVPPPVLPFPIFRVSSTVERYMLYDVDTITWLRKMHHILGVLVGTLPQIPQQNVFLGLPLQLMAEEARLLIEKGLAYLVLDHEQHKACLLATPIKGSGSYKQALEREGFEAAAAHERQRAAIKEKAFTKGKSNIASAEAKGSPAPDETPEPHVEELTALFGSMSIESREPVDAPLTPWTVVPATTRGLVKAPTQTRPVDLPAVRESSYALFKHLHGHGYYLSPALRFGAKYMAYPGDPLRFHSHFLAVGADWDEELDLLDLVGGGRLGTGVKKGFLLGGPAPPRPGSPSAEGHDAARVFCIEWGGM